ncbi:hypothetical protein N7E81_17205 [Reichenbachiella carrageenanivorans]|uniref:Porin n=1 Tax=Reichenbachiella carrageenanivorans TaxID=2979869 RepID=A0ABY6CYU6_9BACT|nr:hypothetical protein [Reichenbachiella carrageenanivorans]UXX79094.1 hypothetical protein N7E81_17205 [Reichenbachiella carrageenanivorans]
MKYLLPILFLASFCSTYAQSTSGKTYDTQVVEFAKLPVLSWKSTNQVDDKPAWEGFLLVKAKLNGIYDLSGGLQNQETFNVGQIDVWGHDNRNRFGMDMYQTQLRIWSKRKTATSDFVGYLEGDFWGGDGRFRLRNVWLDYKFLHIGQDWSFFGDKDIWPNVLDWDGPPSGVWRRSTQIKFYFKNPNHWLFEIGIENPGAEFTFNEEIEPDISASYPVMPDFVGAAKKEMTFGYLRLAAIYRNLTYDYSGTNISKSGYGAALSGYIHTHADRKNPLQFQIVGGRGIASYLASFGGRNYDGVPTGTGSISTAPVLGGWVSYEHFFDSRWHANFVVGISNFLTPEITQLEIGPNDYPATNTKIELDHRYIVVNLMYDPTPGLTLGIEYNLGNRSLIYTGSIDIDGYMTSEITQGRSAQRISFGAFFDF